MAYYLVAWTQNNKTIKTDHDTYEDALNAVAQIELHGYTCEIALYNQETDLYDVIYCTAY